MEAIQWAPKLFPSVTLGCDVSFGLIEKQFVRQNYIQYKNSERNKRLLKRRGEKNEGLIEESLNFCVNFWYQKKPS